MDLVDGDPLEPDWRHLLSSTTLPADTRAFLEGLVGLEGPAGGAFDDATTQALWLEALTHGSTGRDRDYQRLEFLGDRVLGLIIAEWLHETLPGKEGQLSQRLNALVARNMCAEVARHCGLGPYMRLGKQARDDGGADSDNILGDVLEALVGAAFLTLGFDRARMIVRRLWADAVAGTAGHSKHPKSALQEWAAGNRRKMPAYRVISRDGPDHAAQFTVAVAINGVGEAEATGSSKQEAETAAAQAFLETFG